MSTTAAAAAVVVVVVEWFMFLIYYSLQFFDIWITTGCLSTYQLPCNFGEYGTTCSPSECIRITTIGQPFCYAIPQVRQQSYRYLCDQHILMY